MLTFDETTHSYYWDGQRVPGVTSVLAPLSGYGSVPRSVLQRAADLGKAVHAACELDDLGELDEGALDPQLAPFLAAWRDFSRQHAVQWDEIEQPSFHLTLKYAGTPDRIGMVNGRRAVVDIKTTYQMMPTVGPQLAAYAQMKDPSLARFGLQLRKDGSWHLQEYRDPMDWPVFASLLTLNAWCAKHDVTPSF